MMSENNSRPGLQSWLTHTRVKAPPFSPEAGERSITEDELQSHGANTVDPWVAISGNVYSVSEYIDFHPGGKQQLLKGAGKDATSLFEAFHRWVNAEALLFAYKVGVLTDDTECNATPGPAVGPDATALISLSAPDLWSRATLLWNRTTASSARQLRFELPSGKCLGLGLVQQHLESALSNRAFTGPMVYTGIPLELCVQTCHERVVSEVAGVVGDEVIDAVAGSGTIYHVYPASSPLAQGFFDLVVETSDQPVLAEMRAGDVASIRLAMQAPAGHTTTVTELGSDKHDTIGTALCALPPLTALAVGAGACMMLRSTSVRPTWAAVWPQGACSPLTGVWCIAAGESVLPFLPVLALAACTERDGMPPVWLLWDRGNDDTADREGGDLVLDAIMDILSSTQQQKEGGQKNVVKVVIRRSHDAEEEGRGDARPLINTCTEPNLATLISSLVHQGAAPPPHASLLTLVCGSNRAWTAAVDDALRQQYYLASNCLEVKTAS